MKRSVLIYWFSCLLACVLSEKLQAATYNICPGIRVKAPKEINFSDQEKKFICGSDPEENYPWSKVAPSEAQLHLRAFLQQRGYHYVGFEREGTALIAIVGLDRSATEIAHQGGPSWLDFRKMRGVIGKTLTPKLLDHVGVWTTAELKRNGYPCAEAKTEANVENGAITVLITPGPWQQFAKVETETGPDLEPDAFRRYDAFRIGDPYNQDYVDLTRDRILKADLVQGAYFVTECTKAGAMLKQSSHFGAPRAVRLGFGLNTEEYVLGRATWSHSRLGRHGSMLSLETRASYRLQNASARFDWYYVPFLRGHLLRTELNVDHRTEQHFRRLESKLRILPAWGLEFQDSRLGFYAGPAVNHVRTFRGPGLPVATFVSLVSGFDWTSHYYEFFQSNPHRGHQLRLEGQLANQNWLAPVTFQKLEGIFRHHWNVADLDPPLLVVSVRAGAGLTNASDESRTQNQLPPDVFHFLGGSNTLRGFGRNELPGEQGALTSVFSGLELRLVDVLPFHLEPFSFVDVGKLGARPLALEGPWYWSPGGGIRWGSPIGPIRAMLSHGIQSGEGDPAKSHWQFYVSLGEEF